MIKHIVFWKLAEEAEGKTKRENYLCIKEGLEGLVGVIPGLLEAQVGWNENGGRFDVALVSLFDSGESLKAYDTHPAHQKVRAFVQKVRLERESVDFVVTDG